MADFDRKSVGRRIFTTAFKRQIVERIRSGETTAAALSRELSVAPALIRKWIKRSEHGSAAAIDADEDVVPASRVRELEKQVRELQRIIGKQAVTIEILEAAREVAKNSLHLFKGSKR